MTLREGDFVLNDQVIRGLSSRDQTLAAQVQNRFLVPRMYGNKEFGGSTGGPCEPGTLFLEGELLKLMKEKLELYLEKKFEPITEVEKAQLREMLEKKGGGFKFVP